MELSAKIEEQLCIVTVHAARIDAVVAIEFKDHLRDATENAPAHVLLDLSAVTFVDSSGLGAIVAAMKFLAPEQKLSLCGLTPMVDKVFTLTCMNSIFPIYSTAQEARRRIKAAA